MGMSRVFLMAKLTFSGGAELDRALRDLGEKVAGRLGENAVRAGARVIAARAKDHVPVKTGELKRSIRAFQETERRAGARTAYAGSRLFYARFVEFGTVHVAANSFLRKAADDNAQAVVDKVIENLGAGIERETLKRGGG